MKITSPDLKNFELRVERPEDEPLIDALFAGNHVHISRRLRDSTGREVVGMVLCTDPQSERALREQAARQCLSALGQLMRLGLGEAAQHGHIGAHATDPQPQERLAACLVQLQVMAQTFGAVVGQAETVIQEMQRTHGKPSGEAPTVAQGGAA